MIIIAVLGVIGILLIMNLQLCSDTLYSEKLLTRLQNREKGYYVACSIQKAAVKLLEQNLTGDDKYDALNQLWAINPHKYELDEGKISVVIEDENRYFDLNSIIDKDDKPEEKHFKQLQLLLEQQELPPSFAYAILDWIDKDEAVSSGGGSETMKDCNVPCKNAPFDTVEELFYLNTFNEAWYYGKVTGEGKAHPGLKDMFSAHSNGKINVNTAGLEVLQSLDRDLTSPMAQEIINRRIEKPFKKLDDLVDVAGFNTDLIYRIKYLADVASSHFRVTVEIDMGGDRTLLTSIIKRESGSSKSVFWKVE